MLSFYFMYNHDMKDEIGYIQTLITQELSALDVKIADSIDAQSSLALKVCQHLMHNSGKRIRSSLLILSALASGYDPSQDDTHLDLACVIEFIHNATLLHDDVIDNASVRRSRPSANTLWGNKASILTGDFLQARAFQMITALGSQTVFEILSSAVKDIIEGELEQLHCNRNPNMTKSKYLSIIGAKTARLFSVSCQLGSLISDGSYEEMDALVAYGHHLGIAFQIVDDINDYCSSDTTKTRGQDIACGVVTLPFIIAYSHVSDDEKSSMAQLLQNNATEIDDISTYIDKTQAISKCYKEAHLAVSLATESLEILPPTTYREALYKLAQSVIKEQL